jgi:hypothetical protein
VYTSRRGFSGGLGYGLSPLFERPSYPGAGLRRGLGQAETEEGCDQPVPPAERDALRNEIKGWTNPSEGQHFHEGHPDVKAIFNDIVKRLSGLEARPKLLRCSAEARSRANNWVGQLKALDKKIKKRGTTGPAGCKATTWVHITEPFQFTVFRGPTYTVRPGSTRPDCFGQGAAPAPGAVQSSAPPGSVVVAEPIAGSSSTPPEITPVTPAPTTSGGLLPSFDLEGTFVGIPTKYLVYGALALLAWRMMKGK